MMERTICIHVDNETGIGFIIWSDPSGDPDLDELILWLIEEREITGPGTYLLMSMEVGDEDTPVTVEDFALYTVTQHGRKLDVEGGIPTPKTVNLTHWPPKQTGYG